MKFFSNRQNNQGGTVYKVNVFDKSAIIAALVIVFFLLSQFASGEEYQFNNLGSPKVADEKGNFIFKVKGSTDTTAALDSASVISEKPFKTYVDYPRYQAEANYGPSSVGLKQEYNNLPLNFSSNSYTGINLKGRYLLNPNLKIEADYKHTEFKVASKDLGIYKVVDSKTTIDSAMLRFVKCNIFDNAMDSFCYGVSTGLDAYPSLNFENATQIAITNIKDMVLGLNLGYMKEIIPYVQMASGVEYLYGLRLGQDSNLGVDANSKLSAKINLNFLNQKNLNYFSLGSIYSYQEAKVHGSTGSFVDTWTTKASEFGVNASYTWTFESKP